MPRPRLCLIRNKGRHNDCNPDTEGWPHMHSVRDPIPAEPQGIARTLLRAPNYEFLVSRRFAELPRNEELLTVGRGAR